MATDIQHFTATVPTGSTPASPAVITINIPVRIVRQIDWKVPPGHMGTMSFLLAMGGVPVLPVSGQFTFITADGKDGTWHLSDYPDSGAWQVIGFNSGAFPHSVLLTFHTDVPSRPPVLRQNIPPYDLSPAPDLSKAGPPVRRR